MKNTKLIKLIGEIIKESVLNKPTPDNVNQEEYNKAALNYFMGNKIPNELIINYLNSTFNYLNKVIQMEDFIHSGYYKSVIGKYLHKGYFDDETFKRLLLSVIGKNRFNVVSRNGSDVNSLVDGLRKIDLQKGELSKIFGYVLKRIEKHILENPKENVVKFNKEGIINVGDILKPIKDKVFDTNMGKPNDDESYRKNKSIYSETEYNLEPIVRKNDKYLGILGLKINYTSDEILNIETKLIDMVNDLKQNRNHVDSQRELERLIKNYTEFKRLQKALNNQLQDGVSRSKEGMEPDISIDKYNQYMNSIVKWLSNK